MKFIGFDLAHNTIDAGMDYGQTIADIFRSQEFAELVVNYLTYPGIAEAIVNDDTDWQSLKRGAIYYALTLSKSAAQDPGLQQVFMTAFGVADKVRTKVLLKNGWTYNEEYQAFEREDYGHMHYDYGLTPQMFARILATPVTVPASLVGN